MLLIQKISSGRPLGPVVALLLAVAALLSSPAMTRAQADEGKWRTTQSPWQITSASDGNMWFTEETMIGRITPSGDVTEFPLPDGVGQPNDMVAGPDGALWFTLKSNAALGRMTTQGVFSLFPLPGEFGYAAGITVGQDGLLWLTSHADWQIGRVNADGTVTVFHVPDGNVFSAITSGPDGNIWFINDWGNRIVRLTAQGEITQFPIPTWSAGNYRDITAGPDGRLWYTDMLSGIIGRVTVNGEFAEYQLPSETYGSFPVGLAQTPDGSVCFAEANKDRLGCIGRSDSLIHLNLPPGSGPAYLTPGPDGNLWVTGHTAKRIFVIGPPGHSYLPLMGR